MVEGVGSPHGCPLRMGATQHAGDTDKASLDPKTPASRHSGRFPVLSPLAHRVMAEASPVSGDKVTLKLGQEEVKLFRGHLNAGWKVRSPCFQEGEEAEPRKRGRFLAAGFPPGVLHPRFPRSARPAAPRGPCRGRQRDGLGCTHLLQSLLFLPSQIKVPLNHFPDVLGLFIRELGKVQFSPHVCLSGPHLEKTGSQVVTP